MKVKVCWLIMLLLRRHFSRVNIKLSIKHHISYTYVHCTVYIHSFCNSRKQCSPVFDCIMQGKQYIDTNYHNMERTRGYYETTIDLNLDRRSSYQGRHMRSLPAGSAMCLRSRLLCLTLLLLWSNRIAWPLGVALPVTNGESSPRG